MIVVCKLCSRGIGHLAKIPNKSKKQPGQGLLAWDHQKAFLGMPAKKQPQKAKIITVKSNHLTFLNIFGRLCQGLLAHNNKHLLARIHYYLRREYSRGNYAIQEDML